MPDNRLHRVKEALRSERRCLLPAGELAGMSADQVLSFGPFRLMPSQRVLLEGEHPLRLGSCAFDILVTLAERAGEVVSNAELMARVWPNTIVEPGALRVHLFGLRKALGDGRGEQRYIINVPQQGYCFVAPVERVAAPVRPAAVGEPAAQAPGQPVVFDAAAIAPLPRLADARGGARRTCG